MTINQLLQDKLDKVKINRTELILVSASPLWVGRPGNGQTWRHECALCGEILADDTHQYDLTDSVFFPYWKNHIIPNHV